ncbi:MAG TPA: cupin domain-containing protein, partial [archaeon]|nr:cupin domain-containing protein [archaeon]
MSEKKNKKSEVLNLDSMLDYQEESVVSRALINKDVGTVTLF